MTLRSKVFGVISCHGLHLGMEQFFLAGFFSTSETGPIHRCTYYSVGRLEKMLVTGTRSPSHASDIMEAVVWRNVACLYNISIREFNARLVVEYR